MLFDGKKLLLAEDDDALVEALTNGLNLRMIFRA